MKIGVITFHWATNYGAVLQTYALQEALRKLGHEVSIINYKPTIYDDTLWSFIRHRKFMNIHGYLTNRAKEKKIKAFRNKYLNLTQRFKKQKHLRAWNSGLDVLVTGSDQVLNESFLQHGEPNGSTAYFLDFGNDSIHRFSYAASFGVVKYGKTLAAKVAPLIKNFQGLSARENSGLGIYKQMDRNNAIVVPDPTLLHDQSFYNELIRGEASESQIVRSYFLRGKDEIIKTELCAIDAKPITDEGIEEWINAIRSSKHLITNSFHGVVFCLIYHIPFTVVLTTKENVGMNDRFYTLLTPLNLIDRIFSDNEFSAEKTEFNNSWYEIDALLQSQRQKGWNFLKSIK